MKLDHVGFITRDIERFESFWCRGLRFKKISESMMLLEKALVLFGERDSNVKIIKYQKDDTTIEVHVFSRKPDEQYVPDFNEYGLNHISLHVENRIEFLKDLMNRIEYVEVRKFYDPSGWWNIFIRDWDGNWIELRETL